MLSRAFLCIPAGARQAPFVQVRSLFSSDGCTLTKITLVRPYTLWRDYHCGNQSDPLPENNLLADPGNAVVDRFGLGGKVRIIKKF